jgi:hypothetical protein
MGGHRRNDRALSVREGGSWNRQRLRRSFRSDKQQRVFLARGCAIFGSHANERRSKSVVDETSALISHETLRSRYE